MQSPWYLQREFKIILKRERTTIIMLFYLLFNRRGGLSFVKVKQVPKKSLLLNQEYGHLDFLLLKAKTETSFGVPLQTFLKDTAALMY